MWIKETVKKISNKYETNNPFELSSALNIFVFEHNLNEEIMGFYKYIRRNKFIYINSNLNSIQKRYATAHELGHAILHPRTNTPFLRKNTLLSVDKIEQEANRFAVELLLPDQFIYNHTHDNMTIREIGNIYNVPSEVLHLKKI